ncbi:MAG TPA: PqqD family protein [Oscillatoriales cyanobacterium M59_W2019_021]|nr:PqqD family protein [Oscillatoriales cyanobacterium M4454_W2019_049]HIK51752.1 PqqD family protein [Oscillatoriales cyanobacterium M59_W2019_021]
MLNLKSGIYYGLNAVGAWVWNRIQEPQTVGGLVEAIASEYDVTLDRCQQDLFALLQDLFAAQLIEVK